MYLSFMVVVCLSLHWFFIDLTYKRNKYQSFLFSRFSENLEMLGNVLAVREMSVNWCCISF